MEVSGCTLCPRRCSTERGRGFCGAPEGLQVASVCLHRGEEPPLNPIVNVFFAHCNLQCIYCQNWQISGGTKSKEWREESVDNIAERIAELLPSSDGMLGLVTAAHYANRLPAIVDALHRHGLEPTIVYNSSGYESVESLRNLEGIVDIYLPDFKYMDHQLAAAYSHAPDYPEVAAVALKEMKRQVGQGLMTDDNGRARRGIIVRHLVLPGAVANSKQCLDWLADNFDSFRLHLSLMAQYFPPRPGLPAPLNRTLNAEEYQAVCDHADALGFTEGWQQELDAQTNYRPDFDADGNPFEPSAQ